MTTTASSTLCWKKDRRPAIRITAGRTCAAWLEQALRLVVALALACGVAGAAHAESAADLGQMRLERTDEGVFLSAHVRFDLPMVVDEALQKGIPMFFVADAVLFRDRWYWYDKQVTTSSRHMRLSYQPLTRRWRLLVSNAPIGNTGVALGQTFDTRAEALAAVQRISRWKIAEAGEIEPDARYNVDFRFRLDLSQLPRPFQIGVVGQSEWNVTGARNLRLTEATR